MGLDPQAQALLEQMAAAGGPPLNELSVADARQLLEAMGSMSGPGPELPSVEDATVPGTDGDIPVRIFRPSGEGRLPVIVWFHGGGWVLGSVEQSDATCRHLASRSGVAVVSVEYRLAPEHPYPAAPRDCFDALRWVVDHAAELGLDAQRVAVGGDSAGGNLAAVVALMAADGDGPALRYQLLVYPVTDALFTYPSYKDNGEGYLLTADSMAWFADHYLSGGDGDAKDKLVSPIYAGDDELAGLPPAMVITAEYDPLRDEGEAYAKRLEQAGVPVRARRVPGQIHGFFSMIGLLDASDAAMTEAASELRAALA